MSPCYSIYTFSPSDCKLVLIACSNSDKPISISHLKNNSRAI